MNRINENQHWISQVLLERFKIPETPFACYQVQSGEWIPKGIDRTCAWPGYNQLLVSGQADNTLEEAFSKVESGVRGTFKALEDAAKRPLTELHPAIHANMCWYCTFLKLIAPVSKPGAVVSIVFQMNWELENGKNDLLRDLNVPERIIDSWRKECALGRKVVVESDHILQLLYRFQFQRLYKCYYSQFAITKWTISNSPIELPMSDVGLVPVHLTDDKADYYILPIGPNLVLEGIFFFDRTRNSSRPVIRGLDLTQEEAEYRFDCICASAVTEIICSRKIPNIPESITRAKANGIRFHKIVAPKSIASAGLADVGNSDFLFRIVSVEEYKKFVHSHMLPAN